MLKTFTTLIRGSIAEADEAVFDANATRILSQQLRDAASALEHSKRELACAMAHRASEARAIEALDKRTAELETAAIDAINGQRVDLATEVATILAAIADERRERADAAAKFDVDIQRLKQMTEDGRRRLDELRRGLEMSRAQEALRRAGANGRRALATGTGALREAEATLQRIRSTNAKDDDQHKAMEDLERVQSGKDLDQRLSDAGFGASVKTRADDVLARLKATAAKNSPKPAPSSESRQT
jgi:phage shock protein A